MKTTSFVLPLSAALMLGTAAFAQNADQPMNNTIAQPQSSEQAPNSQPAPNQETAQPASDQSTSGQPADQESNGQPPSGQPASNQPDYGQSGAATSAGQPDKNNDQMNNATMYGTSAEQMDPRQSSNGGMPIDQETTVNGIQAACTGVGDTQEDRARWHDYPVKLVVSGTGHQFFAGETVSVTRSDGTQVAQMTCNGPWVLMKLEPGSYHATVDLPGHEAKTVAFTAPSRGQREVNVVYAGTQENSDEAAPDQNRATPTGFQEPNAAPAPSEQNNGTAPQNMPPPNTNQNNNTGMNPQTPHP